MPEPLVLESSIGAVRVHRAGAVVTRSSLLPEGPWPQELAVEGLPLALEDESLRARVLGPPGAKMPSPCDLRVELSLPPIGDSLVDADQKERDELSAVLQRLDDRLARCDSERDRLDRIDFELPRPFKDQPPGPAPAGAWTGALDWLSKARADLVEERLAIEEEVRETEERLARVQRRILEARAHRDSRKDAVSKRVVLRLRGAGPPSQGDSRLELEYKIAGARWVPAYVFRVNRDGRRAELSMRAMVVQKTGEPWKGVRLDVSTAALLQETELPELQSLRIGRRQPDAPRRAWREPPQGAESLFSGLDAAMASCSRDGPAGDSRRPAPEPVSAPARDEPEVDMICGSRAMEHEIACEAPPEPLADPAPMKSRESCKRSFARKPRAPAPAAMVMSRSRFGDGEEPEEPAATPEVSTLEAASDQLRYEGKVLARWNEAGRGTLRPVAISDYLPGLDASTERTLRAKVEEARAEASSAEQAALPEGAVDPAHEIQGFDYRYDSEGPVDVPCDGRYHSVPLFTRSAPVETILVVVPRESEKAVKVASLSNPLHAPLLAGTAEIYLEDEYLVSSPVRTVPPGALLTIGLGVEEALKVARNVHFEEESAGLMGGSLSLTHRIEIEVASRLATHACVEVRERVPVKADRDDKEIEIVSTEADPPWEKFDQAETSLIEGGRRWRFELAPGEAKKLRYSYTVKVDSKNELRGGNRRESC